MGNSVIAFLHCINLMIVIFISGTSIVQQLSSSCLRYRVATHAFHKGEMAMRKKPEYYRSLAQSDDGWVIVFLANFNMAEMNFWMFGSHSLLILSLWS